MERVKEVVYRATRSGDVWKVLSTKNGVVTLVDALKDHVRIKITTRALEERLKRGTFVLST